PAVDSALIVDHLEISRFRTAYGAVGRSRAAVRIGAADLDLGVGNARTVFLLGVTGLRDEDRNNQRKQHPVNVSHVRLLCCPLHAACAAWLSQLLRPPPRLLAAVNFIRDPGSPRKAPSVCRQIAPVAVAPPGSSRSVQCCT